MSDHVEVVEPEPNAVIMFYRQNKNNPNAPAFVGPSYYEWYTLLVNDDNSAKSDGQTYDLVRLYVNQPDHWEVKLYPIHLPE